MNDRRNPERGIRNERKHDDHGSDDPKTDSHHGNGRILAARCCGQSSVPARQPEPDGPGRPPVRQRNRKRFAILRRKTFPADTKGEAVGHIGESRTIEIACRRHGVDAGRGTVRSLNGEDFAVYRN